MDPSESRTIFARRRSIIVMRTPPLDFAFLDIGKRVKQDFCAREA